MTIARIAVLAFLLLSGVAQAAPGRLDPSFGSGGITQTSTGGIASTRVALQPDGKIIVMGGSNGPSARLARYTAAGLLDASFGSGGLVEFPMLNAAALAVQADGRIIVGGFNGSARLSRFNADGSVDATFGSNGSAALVIPSFTIRQVLALPDGRIVVSGDDSANNQGVAMRFTPTGALDPTFDGDGASAAASNTLAGVVAMPDGRLIGAGNNFSGLTRLIKLSRWGADGVLDPAYPSAAAAAKLTEFSGPFVSGVLQHPDGRLMLFSNEAHFFGGGRGRIYAYTPSGQPDPSFPPAGYFELGGGNSSSIVAVAAQPDGRMLVAGSYTQGTLASGSSTSYSQLLRVDARGNVDSTFTADPGAASFFASDIVVQSDGKLVVVSNTANSFTVMRFLLLDNFAYDDPNGDHDGDGIPNGLEFGLGRDPSVKDNDVFNDARLFAMQQYRDILGREGDTPGIAFWTSLVGTSLSRGAVIESFFTTPEFQGAIAPVGRLYFAYFQRVPDYAGLNFWIGYYRAGNSLEAISNAFAGSAEFQNTYGSLDNGQFVDLVYQNVLGRAPDAGGRAFWKGQLDGGMSRGQMMFGFSESDEYRGLIGNEVYVTMAYSGMLRRAPDAGGFSFWVQYMDSGSSGLALLDAFLGSAEYRNRFLP